MAVIFGTNVSRFRLALSGTLLVLALLASTPSSAGQTPQPTPPQGIEDQGKIRVDTNLVTLTLTVTDIFGR